MAKLSSNYSEEVTKLKAERLSTRGRVLGCMKKKEVPHAEERERKKLQTLETS